MHELVQLNNLGELEALENQNRRGSLPGGPLFSGRGAVPTDTV